jgi:hypothetical protein
MTTKPYHYDDSVESALPRADITDEGEGNLPDHHLSVRIAPHEAVPKENAPAGQSLLISLSVTEERFRATVEQGWYQPDHPKARVCKKGCVSCRRTGRPQHLNAHSEMLSTMFKQLSNAERAYAPTLGLRFLLAIEWVRNMVDNFSCQKPPHTPLDINLFLDFAPVPFIETQPRELRWMLYYNLKQEQGEYIRLRPFESNCANQQVPSSTRVEHICKQFEAGPEVQEQIADAGRILFSSRSVLFVEEDMPDLHEPT